MNSNDYGFEPYSKSLNIQFSRANTTARQAIRYKVNNQKYTPNYKKLQECMQEETLVTTFPQEQSVAGRSGILKAYAGPRQQAHTGNQISLKWPTSCLPSRSTSFTKPPTGALQGRHFVDPFCLFLFISCTYFFFFFPQFLSDLVFYLSAFLSCSLPAP